MVILKFNEVATLEKYNSCFIRRRIGNIWSFIYKQSRVNLSVTLLRKMVTTFLFSFNSDICNS